MEWNVLCKIKELDNEIGIHFITEMLIKPKHKYFEIDYEFNADGSYKEKERHITERASEEFERMKRISLDSLDEYKSKDNRNMNSDFIPEEEQSISEICNKIQSNDSKMAFTLLENLMKGIQKRQLKAFLG